MRNDKKLRQVQEIRDLHAEVQRLRAVLASIVNSTEAYESGMYCGTCKHKSDLAEQALYGTKR